MELDIRSEEYKMFAEIVEAINLNIDRTNETDNIIEKISKLMEKVSRVDADVILRDELKNFAENMEVVLKANDHKNNWNKCTLQYLTMRLTEEREELAEALRANDKEGIKHECCDIANFCMMIFDIVSKSK